MDTHTFPATEVRRTGAKIWRYSRPAGSFEHLIWKAFSEEFYTRYIQGLRLVREATHKCGRKAGDLTLSAIEVAVYLVKVAKRTGGKICPAVNAIAAAVHLGRNTVMRALDLLEKHGFIRRYRRIELTGIEGAGPRWEQETNAYELTMPALAERLLGKMRRTPPPPVDFEAAKAAKAAEIRGYIEQEERKAREESAVAAACARLGAGVAAKAAATANECESHFGEDSPPVHFLESVEGKKSGVAASPRPDY